MPLAQETLTVLTTLDAATAPTLMTYVVPTLAFLAIMYFIAWRPQQQEKASHEKMLQALAKGEKVVLKGGIHGKVAEVQSETLLIEIADKTRIVVDKSAVERKVAAIAVVDAAKA